MAKKKRELSDAQYQKMYGRPKDTSNKAGTKTKSQSSVSNKKTSKPISSGFTVGYRSPKANANNTSRSTSTSRNVSSQDRINQKSYGATRRGVAPTATSRQRNTPATSAEMRRQNAAANNNLKQTQAERSRTEQKQRFNTAKEMMSARRQTNEQAKAQNAKEWEGVKNTSKEEQQAWFTKKAQEAQQRHTGKVEKGTDNLATSAAKSAFHGAKGAVHSLYGALTRASIQDEYDTQRDKALAALRGESNLDQVEKEARKKAQDRKELKLKGIRAKTLLEQQKVEELKEYEAAKDKGPVPLRKMAVGAASFTGQRVVDTALLGPYSLASMGARVLEDERNAGQEKNERLKKRLAESGQFTQEELDEEFKRIDRRSVANAYASSGIEILSELMFGGIGLSKKYMPEGTRGILDKTVGKLFGNIGKTAAGRLGLGIAEETAEEWIANPVQARVSNMLTGNRLQSLQEESVRREYQKQAMDLKEMQATSADINSDAFLERAKEIYKESGATDKEASRIAELARDYFNADIIGDSDTAEAKLSEITNILAGGENDLREKWTLKDALEVAGEMILSVGAEGFAGAISSSAAGNAYKANYGVEGVRKLAKVVENLDADKSDRAKAIIDDIDSGKDITGTQVSQIMEWSNETALKAQDREITRDNLVQNRMKDEKLFVPIVDSEYNLSPATDARFEEISDRVVDNIDNMGIKMSDVDAYAIADVVAAYETGTISAEQMNELNVENPEARAVFERETGINLDQYTVKDKRGNIKVAESNIKMQKALFSNAADNYMASARIEQENWNNVERGRAAESLTSDMDGMGGVGIQRVLESVDPRNRGDFMLAGSVARRVYDHARLTNDSWEDVRKDFKNAFPGASMDESMRYVYDMAKRTKTIAETQYYGKQVSNKQSLADSETMYVPGNFTNNSERMLGNTELSTLTNMATTLGVNIVMSDNMANKNANGSYDSSTRTITLNADKSMGEMLQFVLAHEVTHHLAAYAPDEYLKLSRFVMDKAYKADAEKFEAAIKNIQKKYKDQAKQDLTPERALEEIIADNAHEFWQDEAFINDVTSEEPALAQSIINAIKDILDKLRRVLASGNITDENDRQFLFDEIDSYDQTYKLWTNAFRVARDNQANQAINDWQDEVNARSEADTKLSIFDDESLNVKSFSKETKNNLKTQGIRTIESRADLESAIDTALSNKDTKERFTIASISSDIKTQIEADVNQKLFKDSQYTLQFDSDHIRHISEHFNTTSEIADEIERLVDIVGNYDSVNYEKTGTENRLIFEKSYPHADILSVETVSSKKNALYLVTTYYTKKRIQSDPFANTGQKWGSSPLVNNIPPSTTERNSLSDEAYNKADKAMPKSILREGQAVNNGENEEGRLVEMSHGSGTPNFTEFELQGGMLGDGAYFTSAFTEAVDYAKEKLGITETEDGEWLWDGETYSNDELEEALEDGGYVRPFYLNVTDQNDVTPSKYGNGDVIAIIRNKGDAKSSEPITVDDNGDVIPIERRYDLNNPDVRFSLNAPVEHVKDLVAVHNLTAGKLRGDFRLGGFPMPSIAVTNQNHENFGDISLLFGSDTIDPKKNRANKVYSADAWTPTVPVTEYEADMKVASNAMKTVRDLVGDAPITSGMSADLHYDNIQNDLKNEGGIDGFVSKIMKKPYMKYAFLKSQGQTVEIPYKEGTLQGHGKEVWDRIDEALPEITRSEAYNMDYDKAMEYEPIIREIVRDNWLNSLPDELKDKARYMNMYKDQFAWGKVTNYLADLVKFREGNNDIQVVDEDALSKNLDESIDTSAFRDWTLNLFEGIVKNSGVPNQADPYTASGNRKSFNATHYPATLEGIVKAMKEQGEKNVSWHTSTKTLRADTAKTFKSLDEIRDEKGKLKNLSEEDVENIYKELDDKFYQILNSIGEKSQKDYDLFGADTVAEIMSECAQLGYTEPEQVIKKYKSYNWEASEQDAKDILALFNAIENMPVNMFEAKPRRAVGFDEVKAAIIPTSTEEDIKQGLSERGIPVYEYDSETEGSRAEVVNKVADAQELKFSISEDIMDTLKENFNEYKEDKANLRIATEALDDLQRVRYALSESSERDVSGRWDGGVQVRTIAKGISTELVREGYVEFRGQKVESPEDLAKLCQVLRDPRFETFRLVLTKNNKIVSFQSISARMPGVSPIHNRETDEDYDKYVLDLVARTKADGFYMLHNHPSGNVNASRPDLVVTAKMINLLGSNMFKGHVILDHDKYGLIEDIPQTVAEGWVLPSAREVEIPGQQTLDLIHEPEVDHELLGERVSSPGTVAQIGAHVNTSDDMSVLVYVGSSGGVRGIQEISNKTLANDEGAKGFIRNQATEFGSSLVFLYKTSDDSSVTKAALNLYKDGILRDVVSSDWSQSFEARGIDQTRDATQQGYSSQELRNRAVVFETASGAKDYSGLKYSITPKMDADGKILSDGQMEYFKNSMARDEQGRLVPVYHSTNKGGFTIFDPSYSDDHRSLFFAASKDISLTYGGLDANRPVDYEGGEFQSGYYECYLNLENPMIIDCRGSDWDRIMADGFESLFVSYRNGDFYVESSDEWLTIDDIREEYGEGFADAAEAWLDNVSTSDAEIGDLIYTYEGRAFDPEVEGYYPDENDTRTWCLEAEAQGYDGVIFLNIKDIGGNSDGIRLKNEITDVYVAFSSNQVKDVNNLNPTENPDIRYSFSDEDEAKSKLAYEDAIDNSFEALEYYEQRLADLTDEAAENRPIKKFNEDNIAEFYAGLKADDSVPYSDYVLEEDRVRMAKSKNDYFNNINAKWNDRWTTEGEVLNVKSVKTDVRNLIMGVMSNSDTDSQYKRELVNKTLFDTRTAYQLMRQDRPEVASALLYHSAQRMIDNVEFYVDGTFDQYKELKDYLRNTRISIGEEYWADVEYDAFRKRNFGRMKLVKGRTNVDQIYQELEDKFPEWFNEEEAMDVPSQLLQIEHALDSVQPYKEAYSSEAAAELAFGIADDLYEIMVNGDEVRSLADTYKQRYDEKTKAMKQRHAEAMLRVRRARDEGIQAERQKFREYKEKQKERTAHRKEFDSIQKSYKTLTDRLLSNTADKNIPEQYKKDLAKLLAAFDLQTVGSKKREARTGWKAQKTIKLEAMRTALKSIENRTDDFYLNDSITDIIDSLLGLDSSNPSASIEGKTIDALNASELKKIDNLLKALVHEFNTYKNVRINARNQQAQDIADAQVSSALDHAEKFGAGTDWFGLRGRIDKILNLDEVTPAYLFRQIDRKTEGLGLMWKELERAQDKYIRNTEQISKWMQEITGKYHNKGRGNKKYGADQIAEWRRSRSQVEFNLTNGSIKLTPAQMMSVACLANRPQAYQHMVGAGVVVAPVGFQAKMETDLKRKINMALPLILTDADIKLIVEQLTPEQKKMAEELQQLMSNQMAEWGNEASMDVIGIRLFEEKDYFPIKSDRAALERDLTPDQFEQAIRNFGFTKAVQPNARNAIMIDDIFDVVTEHCNNMNLYNSYSKALNDFMKVYNKHTYQEDGSDYSVAQALGHAYSQKVPRFIMTFVQDLNGNVSRGRDTGIESMLQTQLANAKKASVFANVRVLLQQPTAITRAFAVINPKYLKGVKIERGAMEEMFEHCPIAKWKSWGYYDINMGKQIEDIIMNEGNFLEDLATQAYGAADNVTWAAIWQMVKAEMKDTHPDVEIGTDEYWNLCNERMREIVDLTQVVDSPMHRSHAMRDKRFIVKSFTSFMAEPTLTFNMVRDGYIRAREAWAQGNKKEAASIMNKTMSVYVLQAAAVAAAAAIADALRGKSPDGGDDEEDKTFFASWWANTIANFQDELKIWNKIYYIKDAAGIFEGWDNKLLAYQGIESFRDGYNQMTKKLSEGSKVPWWNIYQNLFGGLGYMTGIPVKTLMKDGRAIFELLGGQLPESLVGEKKSDAVVDKDSAFGKLIAPKSSDDGKASSVVNISAEDHWYDYGNSPITVKDGSAIDKLLNHFGLNLTKAEKAAALRSQEQKEFEQKREEIKESVLDYTGEEKAKKTWSKVTTYLKEKEGKSVNELVESGDFATLAKYRTMFLAAGNSEDYFDSRIYDASKKALKKSIVYDATDSQINAQENIKDYLLSHGMTEAEMSDIAYRSDTARDMKVAFRLGDKELMMESLEPLVNAGLTYEDLERLWKNRNRVDLKKYDGRYKDQLKSTGNYVFPVNGIITSDFGHRSSPGGIGSTNHQGIDIGASQGTPVAAADGGVVVMAGWYGGYGKTVQVKHDDGTITQYSHLSWWDVKEGDTVAQGQEVGLVGSTGNSTGPHLHFGVLKNGEYVDPKSYINTADKQWDTSA